MFKKIILVLISLFLLFLIVSCENIQEDLSDENNLKKEKVIEKDSLKNSIYVIEDDNFKSKIYENQNTDSKLEIKENIKNKDNNLFIYKNGFSFNSGKYEETTVNISIQDYLLEN